MKEPWTWVRTQGKGRVFYTAWGHDQRTWSHPGFHNLSNAASAGRAAKSLATAERVHRPAEDDASSPTDAKPFEYVPAKLPFYPPGERWGTTAEPITKMQKPLPAEESAEALQRAGGLRVKLFVTEEKLGGGSRSA